jgi:hypothetical protein
MCSAEAAAMFAGLHQLQAAAAAAQAAGYPARKGPTGAPKGGFLFLLSLVHSLNCKLRYFTICKNKIKLTCFCIIFVLF